MEKADLQEIAEKLLNLIPMFFRKLIKPMEKKVKRVCTPMQMHALMFLEEEGPITMTELAAEMSISKQNLTPIIDRLTELGFVERLADPRDRRTIKIVLSKSGNEFLKADKKLIFEELVEKLESMELDDIRSLKKALDQVNELVERMP